MSVCFVCGVTFTLLNWLLSKAGLTWQHGIRNQVSQSSTREKIRLPLIKKIQQINNAFIDHHHQCSYVSKTNPSLWCNLIEYSCMPTTCFPSLLYLLKSEFLQMWAESGLFCGELTHQLKFFLQGTETTCYFFNFLCCRILLYFICWRSYRAAEM